MIGALVITVIALATAWLGGRTTSRNMGWYYGIRKPSWTPPGAIIGAVWTVLYILTATSAWLAWQQLGVSGGGVWVMGLFAVNAVLNYLWSTVFFGWHRLEAAFWEALALEASILALMSVLWNSVPWAAYLLLPYALWVAFACFLTWNVGRMNRH